MGFTLLQTWITNYCADTVEWCPVTPYLNYFICGTYQLQESNPEAPTEKTLQSRVGQVHLLSVTESMQLCLHCTVDCSSGILDCKWYPRRILDKILFVTANSDGKVVVWTMESGEGQSKINPVMEFELDGMPIILSVDWCLDHDKPDICASDSAGNVSILRLNENSKLQLIYKFEAHNNEVWTATFGFAGAAKIYSGADDNLLRITDIRSGKLASELREHSGGVTSIRLSHHAEHIFASGSYDETVKLWDTRNTSRSLFSLNVGGGIWRIKWDPQDYHYILVAAMYSGCFWLNYDSGHDSLAMACSLEEHSTISYGADISCLNVQEIRRRLQEGVQTENSECLYRLTATCSFYDKKLCLCVI